MSHQTPGSSGRKNMILNTVLVICIVVIIACGLQIGYSVSEYRKAEEKYNELSSNMGNLINSVGTTTATFTETGVTTAIGTDTETSETVTTEPAPVPRDEYREIYEQLSTLKAQYPQLFGWIHIQFDEDHVINLPVMKGEDNNYYISHAYDGTESKAGSIFVDYRNTDRRIDLNQNLIFYGHNMNNSSMFALVSSKYKVRDNFDNVPIVFYSLEGKYTFNVFSVYNAKATENYDTIAFSGDKLKTFCEEKQMKSFFSKNLKFDDTETVVTLVTCTNYASDGRVIVHGVFDSYDPFFD